MPNHSPASNETLCRYDCELLRLLAYGYEAIACASILDIPMKKMERDIEKLHFRLSCKSSVELLSAHNKIAAEIDKKLGEVNSEVLALTGGTVWHRKLIGFTSSDLETTIKIYEIIDQAICDGERLDDDLNPITSEQKLH